MIRNSAKAIIKQEDKILLIKIQSATDSYYILPGGGQDKFESLHNALHRECLEETGYSIEILDLIFIRDYIARNHEFAKVNPDFHQVEFMFDCRIDLSKEKQEPTVLDTNQVGVEWIALNKLMEINLYPKVIKQQIVDFYSGKKTHIYLGDIN